MTEISIRTAIGCVRVFDDSRNFCCAERSDAASVYDLIHEIPSSHDQSTSVRRGVRVYTLGIEMASCLVTMPGSATLAHSNALVRNGILYLGSDGTLCALDSRELTLLWSLSLPSGLAHGLYFPPLERSVIAVGSHHATCVNSDGCVRWSIPLPDIPEKEASFTDDHIHISFRSGTGIAVNLVTGSCAAITK